MYGLPRLARPLGIATSMLACAVIVPFPGARDALAAWSSDPAVNLAIADRASEQVIPKIAVTADGGCYVGWFDLAAGSYDVYLQRLDAAGNELWAHNGILVSDHPQSTSLTDWDLIADSAGHCVLTFCDARAGSDLDIYAYRVSPSGAMEWGSSGLTLSANADYEPAPKVCEASDGDFVFVWARLPDTGDGSIRMQRVSPAGVLRFAADGLAVVTSAGDKPAFCEIVRSSSGDVIVSWLKDIRSFSSLRYIRAQRFNASGAPVWASFTSVFDAASVPIAYQPKMLADGAGGAVIGWHRSLSNMYNACAQHLTAAGGELWPHNGVTVSTDATRHHIDPAFAYDASTGDTYVFWNERNSLQSQWGIYGQKLTAAGARAWGTEGITYLPVDTGYEFLPRCVYAPASGSYPAGALVFFGDEPTGVFNKDRYRGFRVNAAGAMVWAGSPVLVASTLSSRVHGELDATPSGGAILVWEDDRSGTPDVYGQNVNAGGTLGIPTSVEPGMGEEAARTVRARPNPFRDDARIPLDALRITAAGGAAADIGATDGAGIDIADAAGRRVFTAPIDAAAWSRGYITWDGRSTDGRALPGGVYYYRIVSGTAEARGSVVIAR